jgi:two-component system, cell cycle sensor histidine kinase and response regulator CckA
MGTSSQHVQALEPEPKISRSAEPSESPLILLVDDEQMMQELGRDLLEAHGFRVLVACDGVEALELYQQHGYDIALVILDLLMPRLDGGQTFLELKKINRHVKAFFCTGYTPQAVIGSLLEGESLRAVQKPFRPDEFINTVREMLSSNP